MIDLDRRMLWCGFLLASAIFLVCIAFGAYYSEAAFTLVGASLEGLKEMAQTTQSLAEGTREATLMIMIFAKNMSVAFMLLAVGHLLFALPTVIIVATNGILIGLVGVLLSRQGVSLWAYILGLAPHGVIELPALLLAAGYALATFRLSLKSKSYPHLPQRMIFLARFITPLLGLAAIVEAYFTPYLLALII